MESPKNQVGRWRSGGFNKSSVRRAGNLPRPWANGTGRAGNSPKKKVNALRRTQLNRNLPPHLASGKGWADTACPGLGTTSQPTCRAVPINPFMPYARACLRFVQHVLTAPWTRPEHTQFIEQTSLMAFAPVCLDGLKGKRRPRYHQLSDTGPVTLNAGRHVAELMAGQPRSQQTCPSRAGRKMKGRVK